MSEGEKPQFEMNTTVADVVQHTIIPWNDRDGKKLDLRLDNFGFDDWSAVQSKLIREKRAAIVMAGRDAAEMIVEAASGGSVADQMKAAREAETIRSQSLRESGNVNDLSGADVQAMLSTDKGVATFLWVIVDRRYPKQFTIDDTVKMIRSNAVDAEFMFHLFTQVQLAAGLVSDEPESKKK